MAAPTLGTTGMVPEIRVGVMSLAAVIVTARVILGIAAANADAIQPTSALTVSVESLLPGSALRVGADLIGDGAKFRRRQMQIARNDQSSWKTGSVRGIGLSLLVACQLLAADAAGGVLETRPS